MKLICPECQRENEPERIYCHDCGARLDRSALAKEKPKEEDPRETHKRVTALFAPGRGKLRQRFFQLSKVLLCASIGAVLVQMLRPPDLPPRPTTTPEPAQINLDLEDLAMEPLRHGPLHYSDEQVNAYLVYVLKSKQAALSKYLQFEHVLVEFKEGYFRFTVERSIFGYSLFTTAAYTAKIQNGKILTDSRGGYLGRMPIHPALMKYAGFLFSDLQNALERERKSAAKLGGVEFHPKQVILLPKLAPQT
ncbi:MAG: hypothetical protein ACR2HH_13535 [Chthoniobacterales bacterium]